MFKKIITTIIILCTVLVLPLFAISPKVKVTAIGQSSDVGDLIFPVSVAVDYSVYDFQTLNNMPLRFTVALSGGYKTHTISQSSIDGSPGWNGTTPDTYGIIFSTYSFKLSQAFVVPFDLLGSLSTYSSFDCRYERPVTTASYFGDLTDGDSVKTTFTDDKGKLLDIFSLGNGLVGTPELNGNMYLRAFSFKTGLSYSHVINGYKYKLSNGVVIAPQIGKINSGGTNYGGESEYFKLSTALSVSKNIYSLKYDAIGIGSDARLISINFSDSLSYRYLNGDKVPMFAQSYGNFRHGAKNTIKLKINGPQILTSDTYPSAYIKYVSTFEWGSLNNCTTSYIKPSSEIFTHYYKAYIEMRVIGIIHFATYYTWTLDSDSLISGTGKLEYLFRVEI